MRLNTPWISISDESSMGTPLGSLLLGCSQSCTSPCAIPLCLRETAGSWIQWACSAFSFRAFTAKNSNAFLLSSKPLVYPSPLFRTEIFCFKTRGENCHFFYLVAVGKSHKITVSFNQLICLSMQGGKLAFSSPCGLILTHLLAEDKTGHHSVLPAVTNAEIN